MKTGFILLGILCSQVTYAQEVKLDCSAHVEKFYVHEGEERSAPRKTDNFPVKLETRGQAGTILMGKVDGYGVTITFKEEIRLFVSPLGGDIAVVSSFGKLDPSGVGPRLRVQYYNRSVKEKGTGETQQCILSVQCNAAKI